MPVTAVLKNFRVDSFSVVANPQPEFLPVVPDFHFDVLRARVEECVAQSLDRDSVDFVADDRSQASRRALDVDMNIRTCRLAMMCGELVAEPANGCFQVRTLMAHRAQTLDGIAALGDRMPGVLDRGFERVPRLLRTVRQQVGNGMKIQQKR